MRTLAALIAPVLLASAPAFGVVVYNQPNIAGGVNVNGNALTHLGDDVTLAGTERDVTSITVGTQYFFDANHLTYTPDLTLSLFDSTTPGTDGTGHLIASSTTIGAPFVGVAGFSAPQYITFNFPNTLVPNIFYLAVSQNNFDNNFQLIYGSGPTVGTTATAEFGKFSSSTNFSALNIGGVTGLVATVNAVPEPAALSLLGAAGLLALRRRRTTA